ncbi:hypothetical protein [Mucilaginibacter auburnensis]|uniref:Uncharacterized protein n=1 Tax=Mucilaginibacter auburnensis TaxID=1457233 RepID=A0A2H9VSP6_9SPHI|nr:hypothetical protein [Mucilaginibacter auburnensis]PJJ83819.1 hypothetical protein CLV57_0814 [Mucilaginibacter auburnensis]
MKKLFLTLSILACATISIGQLQRAVVGKSSVNAKSCAENKWLKSGFNAATDGLNNHKTWSAESLINIFIPQLESVEKTDLQQVMSLSISVKTESLLRAELNYHYSDKLIKFCRNIKRKILRRPHLHNNRRLIII